MALSYVQYSGNSSTRTFLLPFDYINKTHVSIALNGVKTTAFTWLSPTEVQLTTAPASGVIVDIRRGTPANVRMVDYVDGSILKEADLDLDSLQTLYIAQEALDYANDAIHPGADGLQDAQNRRIKNVADPVNGQDAVNKQYFDSVYTPQLDAKVVVSTTKATEASASAAAALASQTAASSSEAAALASKNASAASEAAALASKNASAASEAAALASKNAASTSEANALASKNSSETSNLSSIAAKTASETARDVTIAARDVAVTSKDTAVTKASEASASAASALAQLNDFRGRFYGPYATDPTTDPLGAGRGAGDIYWNTDTNELKVWNGSAWQIGVSSTGGLVAKSGDTMTGALILSGAPTVSLQAATKQYVDDKPNVIVATATPQVVAAAGAVGVSASYAREDHAHAGVTSVNGATGAVSVAPSGSGANIAAYLTAGSFTWVCPVSVTKVRVTAIGGGGGGGGTNGSTWGCGGGGGGGGAAFGSVNVTPGTSYTVTVGAAGAAGATGVGGTGGTSSFAALMSATGGGGGPARGNVVGVTAVGGTGGTGTGGQFSLPGGAGGGNQFASDAYSTAAYPGPGGGINRGGSTICFTYGGGASAPPPNTNSNGLVGLGNGGGGSGGVRMGAGGASSGGAGTPGCMILEY